MAQKFIFKAEEASRVVSWPCKLSVPVGPGKFEEQEIVARFRLVPPERMADALKVQNMMGANGDVLQLKECLVGFEGLKKEDGSSVDDETALAVMLSLPYAVRGLAAGYWDMVQGRLPKN
jgi:hypothetical protein